MTNAKIMIIHVEKPREYVYTIDTPLSVPLGPLSTLPQDV